METTTTAISLNVQNCKCRFPEWAISSSGVRVVCCEKHLRTLQRGK
jgi:hypothetical protein